MTSNFYLPNLSTYLPTIKFICCLLFSCSSKFIVIFFYKLSHVELGVEVLDSTNSHLIWSVFQGKAMVWTWLVEIWGWKIVSNIYTFCTRRFDDLFYFIDAGMIFNVIVLNRYNLIIFSSLYIECKWIILTIYDITSHFINAKC